MSPFRIFFALTASALMAIAAAPSAEAETLEAGAGYTASDAPLGAPTELRIDLVGRIQARCELSPPAPVSGLTFGRAGEAQGAFAIDCNTPFNLRVRSDGGAFVLRDAAPGASPKVPYRVSLALETDAGRRDLGWCDAAALTETPSGGCPYGAGAAGQGWSSGDHTAIGRTGSLRLRWDEPQQGEAVAGRYGDVIVIELEVRS